MRSEIKDVRREVNKWERLRNYPKLTESLNELAQYHRDDKDFEDAISCYKRVISLSERMKNDASIPMAYRGIAEINAEHGESREEIICSMEDYQDAARASRNHGQIQLSTHVSAWILETVWVVGKFSEGESDIRKACKLCEDSITYLKEYGEHINSNKEATVEAGDSQLRMAKIKRLYCGILVKLRDMNRAQRLWKDVDLYARKTKDKKLRCELLSTKLEFPTNSLKDYLNIAQQLLNEAPPKEKGAALMELSMAYFFNNNVVGAYATLFKIFSDNKLKKTLEDPSVVDDRMVYLFTMREWLEDVAKPGCARVDQRKLYEKLGDIASQQFGSDPKTLDIAMNYYIKMLDSSDTTDEKKLAIESLAVTSLDIAKARKSQEEWQTAIDFHEDLYKITGSLATKCEIFEFYCEGSLKSPEILEQDFEKLIVKIPDSKEYFISKSNIYGCIGRILRKTKLEKSEEYLLEEKKYEILANRNEEHDISVDGSSESPCTDVDETKRAAILKKLKGLSDKMHSEKILMEQKDKEINPAGETLLHDAARNNDLPFLEKLLKMGYNLNQRDNSGWTPLSEAVSAGVLENARLLLKRGANVNTSSKQGLCDDESESGPGITPLMEACHTGNTEMIRLLLAFKARVMVQNEDTWTAVDFLRDYRNNRAGEEEIHELDILISKIENIQRDAKHPVRKGPPPAWTKRSSNKTSRKPAAKRLRRSYDDEEKENLGKYQKTMGALGSRAARNNHTEDDDESDDVMVVNEPSCSRLSSPISERNNIGFAPDFPDDDDILGVTASTSSTERSRSSFQGGQAKFIRAPTKKALPESRSVTNFRSSPDDFIVADPPKKRRNIDQLNEHKRRREEVRSRREETELMDLPRNMDFGLQNREHRLRRSLDEESTSYADNVDGYGMSPGSDFAARNSTSSYNYSSPSKINVTVDLLDDKMVPFEKPKMTQVPSISTVLDVKNIYEQKLFSLIHQRPFDLQQNGVELDDEIVISSLDPEGVNRYRVQLVLKPVTALSIYLSLSGNTTNAHVSTLLNNLSISRSLNASTFECDSEITNLLKALVESNSEKFEKILLDKCHLKEDCYQYLCNLIQNCTVVSLRSTGLNSKFFEYLSTSNTTNMAVTFLDLSYTNLMCGTSLAAFLKLAPMLKELRLQCIDISKGQSDFAKQVCDLKNLQQLDLTLCSWLDTESVSLLLNGCTRLTSLILTGVNLNGVQFSPVMLKNCNRLGLAATGFSNWSSLCDWLTFEDSVIEWIDLSCSDSLTDKDMEAIIDSRSNKDKLLNIRVVRCDALLSNFRPVLDRLESAVSYRTIKRTSILSPVILEVTADVLNRVKGQEGNAQYYIKQA